MKIPQQLHTGFSVLLLLACLHAISGCQTTASKPEPVSTAGGDQARASASPRASSSVDRAALERREKEEIERERQRQKLKTVSGGAVAIGVLGTAIGALVPDGGRIRSAAIGAAVGASGGGIAGNYVANKQQEIGQEIDVLDAMIGDVRAAQARLEGDIRLVDRIIAEQRSELRQLNSDLTAKRIQRRQYRNRVAQLQNDRAKAKAIAEGSKMELQKFRGAGTYYRKAKGGRRDQPQNESVRSMSGGAAPADAKRAQVGKMRLYDNEVRTMSSLVNRLDAKVAQWGKLGLADLKQGT